MSDDSGCGESTVGEGGGGDTSDWSADSVGDADASSASADDAWAEPASETDAGSSGCDEGSGSAASESWESESSGVGTEYDESAVPSTSTGLAGLEADGELGVVGVVDQASPVADAVTAQEPSGAGSCETACEPLVALPASVAGAPAVSAGPWLDATPSDGSTAAVPVGSTSAVAAGSTDWAAAGASATAVAPATAAPQRIGDPGWATPISWDATGRVTHVRSNVPIAPPVEMVNMGGNQLQPAPFGAALDAAGKQQLAQQQQSIRDGLDNALFPWLNDGITRTGTSSGGFSYGAAGGSHDTLNDAYDARRDRL